MSASRLDVDSQHDEGQTFEEVEDIFRGMVERVVALVQRVEGTFEFEVQPLREYFAARHLYETAPYSPPGSESMATKPDRFIALARSAYWFNVLRFYSGCFSKGEIPAIADAISQLEEETEFADTGRPAMLAQALITDWVFAQVPRIQNRIVDYLTDTKTLVRLSVLRFGSTSSIEPSLMIPSSGDARSKYATRAMSVLEANLQSEWRWHLGTTVADTAGGEACLDAWREYAWGSPLAAGAAAYALHLQPLLEHSELDALWIDGPWSSNSAVRFSRYDWITSSEARSNATLDSILDEPGPLYLMEDQTDLFGILAGVFEPYSYRAMMHSPRTITGWPTFDTPSDEFEMPTSFKTPTEERVADILKTIKPLFDVPTSAWSTTLDPWEKLTETLRNALGTRRSILTLTLVSALIPGETSTDPAWRNLLNHDVPLVRRMRYARLRAGDARWWSEVLESEPSDTRLAAIAILLTTGSSKTFAALAAAISAAVDELDQADLDWLEALVRRPTRFAIIERNAGRRIDLDAVTMADLGPAALELVWPRLKRRSISTLGKVLKTWQDNPLALEMQSMQIATTEAQTRDAWDRLVEINEQVCRAGKFTSSFVEYKGENKMPLNTARKVSENPYRYGRASLAAAISILDSEAQSSVEQIEVLASNNHWFSRS